MRSIVGAFAAVCGLAASVASAQTCPPTDYASKAVFNPAKYFSGRWYTLKQIPVVNQPENLLYCVTADYAVEVIDACKNLRCSDSIVRVQNGGSNGSVTGERSTATLTGIIKDPTKPAEASVGLDFLPVDLYAPYWVIEAGSYDELLSGANAFTSENYEWAIITVGKPEVQTAEGCLPGSSTANFKGFWLFSRQPIVSQEVTDKLVALAKSKGLDVSALKTVPQDGCTYV